MIAIASCPVVEARSMDQVVLDMLESTAMQSSALSHILCAESQTVQAALGLENIDLSKLLELNDAAANMVHAVANLELLLKDKLEFIANSLPYGDGGGTDEGDTIG